MEVVKLKRIDIKDFKEKLYKYYCEIFPDDEQKPIATIERMYQEGYTEIISITWKEIIVGFMMLSRIEKNGYAILDYLAVFPEYRNQGIGRRALELLLEQEKEMEGICIEIDKCGMGKSEEENVLREKRKKFYERIGFVALNYDLFLFNVVYTPYIFSAHPIEEDKIVKEFIHIYEISAGKERIQQNCKFIKR